MPNHRQPYRGEGAEGAQFSAESDRTEAEAYPEDSDRHKELLESAEAWDAQAKDLNGE